MPESSTTRVPASRDPYDWDPLPSDAPSGSKGRCPHFDEPGQKVLFRGYSSLTCPEMSALHVVVRPRPSSPEQPLAPAAAGLIDVIAEGVNLTARIGSGPALDFLVDTGLGLAQLVTGSRARVSVPLHAETESWELGLEACGEHVLLSVFGQAPQAVVAVFERKLAIAELRDALIDALDASLATPVEGPGSVALGLEEARRQLTQLGSAPRTQKSARVETRLSSTASGLRLAARVRLRRVPAEAALGPRLERADLHATLMRGKLELQYGQNRTALDGVQLFFDVERLLSLAEAAASSLAAGRPTFRRLALSAGRASLRRGPGDAPVELRVESEGAKAFVAVLEVSVLVEAVAKLSLSLARAMCDNDPEQRNNLCVARLSELAQELLARLEPRTSDETVKNSQPESYRRFVPRVKRATGVWDHGAKMRFMPRWVASVPRIDLRATFLCGDRLVVGGMSETACLERKSGEVLWKQRWPKAASVVTPRGLVRIEPDGLLCCHHLDDGEVRFALRLQPKRGGAVSGAVLYGPSLPKLLAVTEGDRQVTGIDLLTGDVRWRHTAKRPAPQRIRRAGRLLVVGGGDTLLVAIDGQSGDVVWTLSGRLPFTGDFALDHDTGCTLSGTPGGACYLHTLNPWSGEEHWSVELDERPLGRAPLLTPQAIVVPTNDGESSGAIGFCRQTGEKLWEQCPGLVRGASAWLSIDDLIVVNGSHGVLLALDAATGTVRYSHVFSSACEADQPRRLEPILRSGALFVPQHTVHVVRPSSGEILGALPSDLVPDLVRVDENCDVYVAEESGHMAAFSAAARLCVVQ